MGLKIGGRAKNEGTRQMEIGIRKNKSEMKGIENEKETNECVVSIRRGCSD